MHVERGDAECVEVRGPRRAVGEAPRRVTCKRGDDLARQVVLAHIGNRRIIDQVRRIARIQQLEKIEPALGARGHEGREPIVADVRAHPVLSLMSCARVVDRDPGGGIEARAQHIACLAEKCVVALDQQPHELALGDVDAQILQQREQARHGGLALMVLGKHEAFELGPEVSGDPGRQRRHDGLAGRKLPALASQQHGQRPHDQVLDQELFVALETGAFRHTLDLDDLRLVDRHLRALGPAAAVSAPSGGRGLGCLLHAARLDLGSPFQTLQPRDLLTQLRVLCLEPGDLLQGLHEQRLQLFEAKPVDDAR